MINNKALKNVIIYTDGSCRGNPGPGGYSYILQYRGVEKSFSGGFRKTTNNRMEMTAVIAALSALKEPCAVDLYSDSTYVVNAVVKRWIENWQRRNWHRSGGKRVPNSDLWKILVELLKVHTVTFHWTRGHSVNEMNCRCDELAQAASGRPESELPIDTGYERNGGGERDLLDDNSENAQNDKSSENGDQS